MARIETEAHLRDIIGHPRPTTLKKVGTGLDAQARAFLEAAPFAVLSTVDAEGRSETSPKGDGPGFIHVEGPRAVVLPERAGNNMGLGLSNIVATGQASLLVLIPGTPETLRLGGRAWLDDDPALCARLGSADRPARLGIRIEIERVFFHCAKAFLRSELWKPESWPERRRVSFGRILAEAGAIDGAEAESVDASIDETYRTRLWHPR